MDRMTGRSRASGSSRWAPTTRPRPAIAALSGKDHDGRPLTVNEARPREPRSGGGGGGGGGGYGGGGGGGGVAVAVAVTVAAVVATGDPAKLPPGNFHPVTSPSRARFTPARRAGFLYGRSVGAPTAITGPQHHRLCRQARPARISASSAPRSQHERHELSDHEKKRIFLDLDSSRSGTTTSASASPKRRRCRSTAWSPGRQVRATTPAPASSLGDQGEGPLPHVVLGHSAARHAQGAIRPAGHLLCRERRRHPLAQARPQDHGQRTATRATISWRSRGRSTA